MVRASLHYVNWKERKRVAANLKAIYRAATEQQAKQELDEFVAQWGGRYQAIGKLWKDHWDHVTPLFDFPAEVRRIIYTTNAVESLHMSLRKIIKTRGSFSERRGRFEATLLGAAKHQGQMGPGAAMKTSAEPI
jgi:putative transposase